MIRRYGDTPVRGQRYIHRPGAYAILPRGGQLLLTYQGDPHFEYQLPGGGIDPGESPIAALHREVFEETGWRIAAPRKIGTFRRFAYMPDYDMYAEKICHIYLAVPVRPHGPPREAGHAAVWAAPENALDLLYNQGDRAFLAALF
jgi:8-oxo-dGTP diphosphatase